MSFSVSGVCPTEIDMEGHEEAPQREDEAHGEFESECLGYDCVSGASELCARSIPTT